MRLYRYLSLCVEEAARSMWFHRRVVAPALAVIAVSLTVLGAFLLVSENLDEALTSWRERGQLQIFMSGAAGQDRQQGVEAVLRGSRAVEGYRFVAPEEAAALFRSDFGELGELLDLLEENPLPASYAVTIVPEMRSERVLELLARELGALPGVDGVQYDLQIIGRLELGVRALRLIGLLLGGTVLVAAVITTANVIRVLVVSRRSEVDTMRLVGASEAVILGRFLVEGALQGTLAGVTAVLGLYAVWNVGLAWLDRGSLGFLSVLPLSFLGLPLVAALIVGGAVTGVIGSWLAFGPGGLRVEV